MSKKLVNKLDKLVEDKNIYNKDKNTTVDKVISDYEEKINMLASEMEDVVTEKDTSLHVEDAANWFAKLDLFSNSYQESREGYNLFDKNNAKTNTLFAQSSTHAYSSNASVTSVCIQIKQNTPYTVAKGCITSRFQVSSCANKPESGENYTNNITRDTSKLINITSGEEDNYLLVYIHLSLEDTDVTAEEILDKLMILEGTYTEDTLPDYEPYGAMPSPPFPSDVQVVTGKQKFTFTGNNIFDGLFEYGSINNVTGQNSRSHRTK